MSSSVFIIAKRLEHAADLPLPRRMTSGSSGCDICAAVDQEVIIEVGGRVLFRLEFVLKLLKDMKSRCGHTVGLPLNQE